MQLRACVSQPPTCLRTPGRGHGGTERRKRRNTGDEQMQTRRFTATRREQSHVVPPTCVNSKEKGGCWEDGWGGAGRSRKANAKSVLLLEGKQNPAVIGSACWGRSDAPIWSSARRVTVRRGKVSRHDPGVLLRSTVFISAFYVGGGRPTRRRNK